MLTSQIKRETGTVCPGSSKAMASEPVAIRSGGFHRIDFRRMSHHNGRALSNELGSQAAWIVHS